MRVFVMGSRTWEEFSLWPPAGERARWYLGRWGTLAKTAPIGEGAPTYHYNPHDPTPAVGGPSLNIRTRAARTSAGVSTATTCSPTPARC